MDQPLDDLTAIRERSTHLLAYVRLFGVLGGFSCAIVLGARLPLQSFPRSAHRPQGDVSRPNVSNANCMVARSALIIALCYACFIFWVLEQPSSSLMTQTPVLQLLQQAAAHFKMEWRAVKTYMGLFGGESPKPMTLYSNNGPMVAKLARNMKGQSGRFKSAQHTQLVTIKQNKNGKKSVSGGPKLKESQAYTPGFADAVLLAFLESSGSAGLVEDLEEEEERFSVSLSGPPPWADLRMEEVLGILKPQVGQA